MNEPPTTAQAIRAAAERLAATSDTARLDAEVLMAHALGTDRSRLLLMHMRDPAPAGYAALVDRRAGHEPVAYITGTQEFYGLPFRVGPEVLIPRSDSETLVEAALAARPDARRVLDCGTGSGALLLATLAHLPQAEGLGIDRSPAFDLILANPPYVEADAALDTSVRGFEPAGALFAGPEGLDDYRVLVPRLPALLAPGGVALVEIGHAQAAAVSAIGAACGLASELHRDLAGRARVIAFRG